MVDRKGNSNRTIECKDRGEIEERNITRRTKEEYKYDWDNKEQGLMLGGYFYGYTVMMPFAGFISAKFGVRRSITGMTHIH